VGRGLCIWETKKLHREKGVVKRGALKTPSSRNDRQCHGQFYKKQPKKLNKGNETRPEDGVSRTFQEDRGIFWGGDSLLFGVI